MNLKLPNFICVGAQKSGTTTLYKILKQHPQVFLPHQKEVGFFHNDQNYSKGKKFYSSFYKSCRIEKVLGDITPEYMYYEKVPSRIYETLGEDIKLVFMLRNPIERAYSGYLMACRRGHENKSFLEAIELEKSRIFQNDFLRLHFSYIDRGFYAKQIKRYLRYFSLNQMFFIVFEEDFIELAKRQETISKLLHFLGIEIIPIDTNIKANPHSQYRNKFFQQLFNNPRKHRLFRELGKILIPNSYLRQLVLNKLEPLTLAPSPKNNLETKIKHDLLKKYFYEDILELEEIINRKLTIWLSEV